MESSMEHDMKVTFLSAHAPLTKTYQLEDGRYDATPYPLTSEFTSHERNISSLEELYAYIIEHSAKGHCLLKGNLMRPIRSESRAGLMQPEMTGYIVLDFDGLRLPGTLDEMLAELGLGDVDYILQYSASHGIRPDLRAHVFMLLATPHMPERLKQWLKWLNMTSPTLSTQLELTKTAMAIHWPLDITVCQNDKLIYIAPPICANFADPVASRISFVKRAHRAATVPPIPHSVDEDARERVGQLRAAAGLPSHKLEVKYIAKYNAEILNKPDRASVTGVKVSRDFVYLNLNGGDSFGYFHPTGSPDVLYNFKGEPNYLLRELCPEYHQEAVRRSKGVARIAHRPAEESNTVQRFIINDAEKGSYFKVEIDPVKGATLLPAPTLRHIADWCVTYKLPVPDVIEDWRVVFDPSMLSFIDAERRLINRYRPTEYQREGLRAEGSCEGLGALPTVYRHLLFHVCGSCSETAERLLNWIAYIWQTGLKPKTAWVLHGTYGTGKGRLQKVLRALFGEQFVGINADAVNDTFNEHILRAQILWIDEVTTESLGLAKATPKLRLWISEDSVPVRGMRIAWREEPSFMGVIAAGNERNIIELMTGDRRWNVAPRQEARIKDMPWAAGRYLDEDGPLYDPANLLELAKVLGTYQVDVSAVRTPLVNEARDAMMRVTQTLPDDIVQALAGGDVEFLLQHISPSDQVPTVDAAEYQRIVDRIMTSGGAAVPLRNVDLMHIFRYIAGWHQQPGKFVKAVSKYGLDLSGKRIRHAGKVMPGAYFDFKITDQAVQLWEGFKSAPPLKAVK
jgi:hypothetical protein